MKKNGFTLVELIAVLVVLGVLALVTVPAVVNVIKKTRQDAYNDTIVNIKLAMQNWKNDNYKYLPKRGEKLYLTISQLKNEKYLEQKIINPLTEKPIPNDMLLTITNDTGAYEYEVLVNSGTETDNYEGLTPYIEVEGNIKRTIYVGDTYSTSSAYAFNGDGTTSDATINSTLIDATRVSTSEPGVYYVLHKATINNISVAYVETVVVENRDVTCRITTTPTAAGVYTIGDSYTCDPGDGVSRVFYVLDIGTSDISLIMEKNIGSNISWNSEGVLINGPETALSYLKRVTRKWNSVSVALPDATDIAHASGDSSWTTSAASPSLPGWLHGNANCRINTCTEEVDSNDTGTTSGYWTSTDYNDSAYAVNSTGSLTYATPITNNNTYGVRPVITVPKNKISN